MLTLLRHTLSILLLPFLVVVVLPYFLLTGFAAGDSRWTNSSPVAIVAIALGLVCGIAGFALFAWCVSLFIRAGEGTLAPWDPTRKLVAVGPYQHVRNPMITGVALMLAGEALVPGSWVVGAWAGIFILINHIYFLALEEPGLIARFGEAYRVYQANVPRWIPRRKPWSSS